MNDKNKNLVSVDSYIKPIYEPLFKNSLINITFDTCKDIGSIWSFVTLVYKILTVLY